MAQRRGSAYAAAGVDIDRKMAALDAMRTEIESTFTRGALGRIGLFGGLFQSPGRDRILVASTDGVGTKLKVAVMVNRHDTVGQDIVNHCVNDILVQGATPLFFLDYIGASRLDPEVVRQILHGLCVACRENSCALIGGETAEMPDVYRPGEYDLVGTIVGMVSRRELITGNDIRAGDVLIGLPSSGLHTNGYTLARRVIFDVAGLTPDQVFPGEGRTVAEVLLSVHRSYLRPVQALRRRVRIRGLAHITGGGFPDNLPRILPRSLAAVVDTRAWVPPPVFGFIQRYGDVDREEMYRVFNMGIGWVIVVRESDADRSLEILRRAGERPVPIGEIRRRKDEAVELIW